MNFRGKDMLPQLIVEGIKRILFESTGRGLLEARAWFSPEFSPCVFPLAKFALYPLL